MISDAGIEALGRPGLFVVDGFLGSATALVARAEVAELIRAGALGPAGISRGTSHRQDLTARGDETCFLTPGRGGPALAELALRFEELRSELCRRAFLPLRRMEIQLARYPGAGEAYQRHRDVFPGEPGRVITAILYLVDEGFRVELHGGALRVGGEDGEIEVEPSLDRLVLFRSELEHEVLPARAERLAVTCWLYGP